VRDDSVKLDFSVVTESDVSVVPPEIDVVVCVVVSEYLDASAWNGAIQLERVVLRHPATYYVL